MTKKTYYLTIRQENRDLLVRDSEGKLTSDPWDRRCLHVLVARLRGKAYEQIEAKHRDPKDYRHERLKSWVDRKVAEFEALPAEEVVNG